MDKKNVHLGLYEYRVFTQKQAASFMWQFLTCNLLTIPELACIGKKEVAFSHKLPSGESFPVFGISQHAVHADDFHDEREFIKCVLPLLRQEGIRGFMCVAGTNIHDTRRVSLAFSSIDREKDEVTFILNVVEAMSNHADPTKWKFTEREEKFIGYLDEAAKDVSHGHAKRTVV